ncbi:hypothetical protein LCGC14_1981650 [marine sediment metagenome]|uniref:Uncharacterized protein n=1 Tax=marine sediment metagenome TaxID=412755 RepID=A0A0F9I5T8_9ZZZZ
MKKLCSCGFPQSFPIPHEHDRTERENQIIKHYGGITEDLYEALKDIIGWMEKCQNAEWNFNGMLIDGRQALAKVDRKEG